MDPRILSVSRCLEHLKMFQTKEGYMNPKIQIVPGYLGWLTQGEASSHGSRNIGTSTSASVYYTERKPKNKKNGGGLGTRLVFPNECERVCDVLRCTKYS